MTARHVGIALALVSVCGGGYAAAALASGAHFTRSLHATSTGGAAHPHITVFDVCTQVTGSTFDFTFGYDNHESITVAIPVESQNYFDPSPADRGQPTVFEPGSHTFTVTGIPVSIHLHWHLISDPSATNVIEEAVGSDSFKTTCQPISTSTTTTTTGTTTTGTTTTATTTTATTTTTTVPTTTATTGTTTTTTGTTTTAPPPTTSTATTTTQSTTTTQATTTTPTTTTVAPAPAGGSAPVATPKKKPRAPFRPPVKPHARKHHPTPKPKPKPVPVGRRTPPPPPPTSTSQLAYTP